MLSRAAVGCVSLTWEVSPQCQKFKCVDSRYPPVSVVACESETATKPLLACPRTAQSLLCLSRQANIVIKHPRWRITSVAHEWLPPSPDRYVVLAGAAGSSPQTTSRPSSSSALSSTPDASPRLPARQPPPTVRTEPAALYVVRSSPTSVCVRVRPGRFVCLLDECTLGPCVSDSDWRRILDGLRDGRRAVGFWQVGSSTRTCGATT